MDIFKRFRRKQKDNLDLIEELTDEEPDEAIMHSEAFDPVDDSNPFAVAPHDLLKPRPSRLRMLQFKGDERSLINEIDFDTIELNYDDQRRLFRVEVAFDDWSSDVVSPISIIDLPAIMSAFADDGLWQRGTSTLSYLGRRYTADREHHYDRGRTLGGWLCTISPEERAERIKAEKRRAAIRIAFAKEPPTYAVQ